MPDNAQQKHRTNRVFKSLHKPLTYLGVERTLFYFVCVGAVGAFNLFNSILAGIAVFIGGFAFGHWVTNSDPAFLRILAKSERYKLRYDAAKQLIPRVEVRADVIEMANVGMVQRRNRPRLALHALFQLRRRRKMRSQNFYRHGAI